MYEKIKRKLDQSNIRYQEHRHPPVRTSKEAAKVRGSKLHEGAKALIFLADDKPIQIIVRGDKRVDTSDIKKQFGFNKLKMASPEEAERISSVPIGAVPPFGNLFDDPIPVYVTSGLLENDEIEFNAGLRTVSIRMKTDDWRKLVNPIVIQE